MSTTVRTDLDDAATLAGFKRIQEAAIETARKMDESNKSWARSASISSQGQAYMQQLSKGARLSAEGLGFVSQALGRVNPSLALLGEQSTKQLPTIMALGTSMSRYVFAGGALAAIGISAGKIAAEMGRVRHETVGADSALGQLIKTSKDINPNSFLGRLANGTLARAASLFGTSIAEIEEQQSDLQRGGAWRDKGDEGRNRSEGIANTLRDAQNQRQKVKDYTAGVSGMDSAAEIQRKIEFEKQRIAGLVQLGKLTDEEAQASDAYTQALEAQYDEVIGRINELRDIEETLANEQKTRWIGDIKTQSEAKKVLSDLIGEYRQLYNTDQLTGEKRKNLLAGIAAAQSRLNEKLAEERAEIKANIELIKQETAARWENKIAARAEHADQVKAFAEKLRAAARGGGGGGLVAQGPGGVDGQGAARPQGWQAWGGASRMSLNPFDQGGGEGGGADIGGGGLDAQPGAINPQLRRKAKNAARRAFLEQVDDIRRGFDDAMAAMDKLEKAGINVDDQRKEARKKRNQAMVQARGERGEEEQQAVLNVQQDARDKQIEAAAKRQKLSQDQLEVLRQVVALYDAEVAENAAQRKELEAIKATLGRAANNQRGNGR